MPLGTTNITVSDVKTELGNSSNDVSVLCSDTNISKWSFYAPGNLSVDSNKNAVWTAGANKLGDFRSYNHSVSEPSGGINQSVPWGPSTTPIDIIYVSFPQQMNIKEFAVYGDYITSKFYTSTADRDSETNAISGTTQIDPIVYNTITPLAGHTRDTTQQAQNPQQHTVTINPSGFSNTDYVYGETYISDISGNRKINMGSIRSDGYFTFTFNKRQAPTLGAGNVSPSMSGHAVIYRDDDTGGCNGTELITLSVGSSKTLSGYVTPFNYATGPSGSRMHTNGSGGAFDIILVKNGSDFATLATGAIMYSYETYKFFSISGITVDYGDVFRVDIRLTSGSWTEVSCI